MSEVSQNPKGLTTTRAAHELRRIFSRNRGGERAGTYAVCSAHPTVLESSVAQAVEDGSVLHVESTSSQVNQFGGYTGNTPEEFAESIHKLASRFGLPAERVLLGADHLGPFAWRKEIAATAMEKACELARASVRAAYQKIHLDASMPCADDGGSVGEETIAERAAMLCEASEDEATSSDEEKILYVVGTEVPPPGGEVAEGTCPPPTRVEDVHRALELFRKAFLSRGLSDAWERVIAIVVQPGVEFGDTKVFDYDPSRASALASGLPADSSLIYEAHSTDYQTPSKLTALVDDHFAILKVGPWLTFAYREAIFALSQIEREMLGRKRGVQLSTVKGALDAEMLRNPVYWESYYKGNEDEVALARAYSFSDRSRYYWHLASVQEQVAILLHNLSSAPPPGTLLSQYLPFQCEAVRNGEIVNSPQALIQHHIQRVLKQYAYACGLRSRA